MPWFLVPSLAVLSATVSFLGNLGLQTREYDLKDTRRKGLVPNHRNYSDFYVNIYYVYMYIPSLKIEIFQSLSSDVVESLSRLI